MFQFNAKKVLNNLQNQKFKQILVSYQILLMKKIKMNYYLKKKINN